MKSEKSLKIGKILFAIGLLLVLFLIIGVRARERHAKEAALETEKIISQFVAQLSAAREALSQDDIISAAELYEKALILSNENESLRENVAMPGLLIDLAACEILKAPEDEAAALLAKEHLQKALKIKGASKDLKIRAARDLGALAVRSGDLNQAESWYRRALDLDPADENSINRLALLIDTKPGAAANPSTEGQ